MTHEKTLSNGPTSETVRSDQPKPTKADNTGIEAQEAMPSTLDTTLQAFKQGFQARRELVRASTELAAAEASLAVRSGLVLIACLLLAIIFLPGLWVLLLALVSSVLVDSGWSLTSALGVLLMFHLLAGAVLAVVMIMMFKRMQFQHTREGIADILSPSTATRQASSSDQPEATSAIAKHQRDEAVNANNTEKDNNG